MENEQFTTHDYLMESPEPFAVMGRYNGYLALGYDTMRRMADKDSGALVKDFFPETRELPFLPAFVSAVHQANTQEVLGGAVEELVLLAIRKKGAGASHARVVALKEPLPGTRAMECGGGKLKERKD